jgi:hypothetical protein
MHNCHTSYINKEGFDMIGQVYNDIPAGQYIYFHEFAQNWASEDGSYGGEGLIVYNPEDLTDEQRHLLSDLHDSTRVEYIMACLDQDEDRIAEIEADYV